VSSTPPYPEETARAEAEALRNYDAKQRRVADRARKSGKSKARKRARDYRRRISP
jgi:hypothetical protein